MQFHAETLPKHGLYVRCSDGNRVIASTIVRGTFTEKNLYRLRYSVRPYTRLKSGLQRMLNF